jgi:hypothetical protein
MPEVTEKQVSINILVGGTWHRAFELTEAGERHIMAWKGCPLNDVEVLNADSIDRQGVIDKSLRSAMLCRVCFADELAQ